MLSEYQKETAFLRQLIRYDHSPQRHGLEEKLAQIQNDGHSLRRATRLLAWPAALTFAGLCYELLFLKGFPQNMSQPLALMVGALGLGSFICLLGFTGLRMVYRRRLNEHREQCRHLVIRFLSARLGQQTETNQDTPAVGLHPMASPDASCNLTPMINTMKNKMLVGAAMLLLTVTATVAAENTGGSYDYYRAKEIDADAFGSVSFGKYTIDHLSGARVRHNANFGLGSGLSYFLTRNLGIGADIYSENKTGALIDSASMNMTLRLPLGQSGFAPFVYGGGGKQFDMVHAWFAQVGAGMEYRFTPLVGVFMDSRWVLPDHASYYGVVRLGVRFAF